MRRSIEFGEPHPHDNYVFQRFQRYGIQRYDACQLQQIYAGAVLLARYSMCPDLVLRVLIAPQDLAAWLSCMYSIDLDTSAVDCIVTLALTCALHYFTCSSTLHM